MREGVGELYKDVTQKALDGTASPRQAIKAFCLECVVWKRDEVTNCAARDCPLWLYRPYQESAPAPGSVAEAPEDDLTEKAV